MTLPRLSFVFVSTLVLVACQKAVAFPTTMPAPATMTAEYATLVHDLSPLKTYHFHLSMLKNWKSIDVRLRRDPKPGELLELAAFRQPGEWVDSSTGAIRGEIALSVAIKAETGALQPMALSQWLKATLTSNAGNFKILRERTTANVADLLIRFSDGDQNMIGRFWSVPYGHRVYVFTETASEADYPALADAFYVVPASFQPSDRSGASAASSASSNIK